jgi:hypothetical protein
MACLGVPCESIDVSGRFTCSNGLFDGGADVLPNVFTDLMPYRFFDLRRGGSHRPMSIGGLMECVLMTNRRPRGHEYQPFTDRRYSFLST